MFRDVPQNHWARYDIEAAAKLGVMMGYPDGTFAPDKAVTRAELAAILRRLAESDPQNKMILSSMRHAVYITSQLPDGRTSVGSGCWIAPWRVLTNAHVITTLVDGKLTEAKSVSVYGYPGADFSPIDPMRRVNSFIMPEYDLALVTVEPPKYRVECVPVKLATREPDQGDTVWAIGNPFGQPWDVCSGVVRHTQRIVNYWQRPQAVYGLDVSINPGNSGGMLLDVYGRLVGVPCAGVQGANDFTYAVPLPQIEDLLRRAKEAGLL